MEYKEMIDIDITACYDPYKILELGDTVCDCTCDEMCGACRVMEKIFSTFEPDFIPTSTLNYNNPGSDWEKRQLTLGTILNAVTTECECNISYDGKCSACRLFFEIKAMNPIHHDKDPITTVADILAHCFLK